MRFPSLTENIGRTERGVLAFKGVNYKDIISDNELSSGLNLSARKLPAMAPCVAPETMTAWAVGATDPEQIFFAGGVKAWIQNDALYYNGSKVGDLTAISQRRSVVDFNGYIVVFPDKKYYCYDQANTEKNTFGSFTAPDLDFITTHYNRVFGVKGSDIRGSKWGDFKTWESFAGTEQDSWATDVYSEGSFTGVKSFNNHLIMWKDDFMYELYGAIPSQFTVQEVGRFGLINQDAFTECDGIFYFMTPNAIKAYAGGVPRTIGENLMLSPDKALLASDGRNVYVFTKDGSACQLHTYDTMQGTWFPEGTTEYLSFAVLDGQVYGLLTTGAVHRLGTGTGTVTWQAVTKDFDEGFFNNKYTKAIKLKAKMAAGATLSIKMSTDGGVFSEVASLTATEAGYVEKIAVVPIVRASRFQLKFDGVGDISLIGEREFYIASEPQGETEV